MTDESCVTCAWTTSVAGAEFADYGHHGHTMIIVKALYGLKTSGARFHERLAQVLTSLGYKTCKAVSDVWMKDCGTHYEYVCTWVDDLLYSGNDPKSFYDALQKIGFKLKGVGEPTYNSRGRLHSSH